MQISPALNLLPASPCIFLRLLSVFKPSVLHGCLEVEKATGPSASCRATLLGTTGARTVGGELLPRYQPATNKYQTAKNPNQEKSTERKPVGNSASSPLPDRQRIPRSQPSPFPQGERLVVEARVRISCNNALEQAPVEKSGVGGWGEHQKEIVYTNCFPELFSKWPYRRSFRCDFFA